MFAAGFQDNEVGEVLGTSDNTGAGGANNWTYEDLMTALRKAPASPFKPLPKGADFGLAMRRSIRVGRNSGRPLEELGIVPDDRHYMTKRDLLAGNEDLLKKAAEKLRNKPIYSLSVKPFKRKGGSWGVVISCASKVRPGKGIQKISYVDIHVNGRFVSSINAENGALKTTPLLLGQSEGRPTELLVQAFNHANTLVATRRYAAIL